MNYKEIATKYYEAGLSVIPVDSKKLPIGTWKKNTQELLAPSEQFKNCEGIGLVCGSVSGNIEVIDVDEKYSLDGNLFNEYKNLIFNHDKNLLKKLTVQKTENNGFHLIYKCKEIEGNKKLANRHCTQEEKDKNPKDKIRVLIETRGSNGYIKIAPSPKYEIIYGDLNSINEISPLEREILFVCAKTLNEVFETPTIKKNDIKTLSENVSPFEDWNNRGDVLSLLESEGWKVKLQRGDKNLLLRPAGEGMWSADWNEAKRIFYVFTSSTEFEQNKGYNASQVLAKLKFRDNFSECAKWLLKEGYGNFTPEKKEFKKEPQVEFLDKIEIKIDDDNFDFLANNEDCDRFIQQKIDGTFKMGDKTGWDDLDEYWRFKDESLVMVLGHDNAGKSVVTWFLAVMDCYFNEKNYIIYAGENKVGTLKYRLMEFYMATSIKKMSVQQREESKKWVEEHFAIIRNDIPFTYKDMLAIGRKLSKVKKYTRFIIEPYNVLIKESVNEHQYDYRAMLDMKLFITQTGIGITLNIHAATEAVRKVYSKEHTLYGYAMPPNKADAEGGGKFPNKADDFMVIHRLANHPDLKFWTQIHVQKIKENETGGKQTDRDNPFLIKLQADGTGFENQYGINPMRDRRKGTPSNILPPIPKQTEAFEPAPIKPNGAFTTPILKKDNYKPSTEKDEWDFGNKLDVPDDAF